MEISQEELYILDPELVVKETIGNSPGVPDLVGSEDHRRQFSFMASPPPSSLPRWDATFLFNLISSLKSQREAAEPLPVSLSLSLCLYLLLTRSLSPSLSGCLSVSLSVPLVLSLSSPACVALPVRPSMCLRLRDQRVSSGSSSESLSQSFCKSALCRYVMKSHDASSLLLVLN